MRNHLHGTLAIDFVTVPTVRFEVLYVFVVLSLERRCILHVNVRLTLRSLRSPLEARQGVLHRTLTRAYARYYNEDRPHMSSTVMRPHDA